MFVITWIIVVFNYTKKFIIKVRVSMMYMGYNRREGSLLDGFLRLKLEGFSTGGLQVFFRVSFYTMHAYII